MNKYLPVLTVLLSLGTGAAPVQAQNHYQSFTVSTYAIQGTVRSLMNGDLDPAESWATMTRNLKVDKIYIEVMRNHTLVDETGLEKLKKFYQDKGVQVCGGLAYSVSEANGYQGFDYADPDPFEAPRDILIPEIKYFNILTHDAWGDALGISPGGTTYPVVLSCDYSKGKFYVLTIPNDLADLYALPPAVLGVIRATLGTVEPIRIDNGPAQVALFRYDNNTFIVQNYLPTAADITVSVAGTATNLQDLLTAKEITPAPAATGGRGFGGGGFGGRGPTAPPPRTSFAITVPPHSYAAFAADKAKN